LVAIRADFMDFLGVARGCAFVPVFLTGSRPVDGFADFEAAAQ